jgi:hypothetical protein
VSRQKGPSCRRSVARLIMGKIKLLLQGPYQVIAMAESLSAPEGSGLQGMSSGDLGMSMSLRYGSQSKAWMFAT